MRSRSGSKASLRCNTCLRSFNDLSAAGGPASPPAPPRPRRRVKSYEGKLATLTAINSALQTENDKLRKQLEAKPTSATDEEVAGARRRGAGGPGRGGGASLQLRAQGQCGPTDSTAGHRRVSRGVKLGRGAAAPSGRACGLCRRLWRPPRCAPAELKEEFALRLGAADRQIAQLQVGGRAGLAVAMWGGECKGEGVETGES